MKYNITLHGHTYEIEVEIAEPMDAQEFRSYVPAAPAPAAAPAAAPVAAAAAPAAPAAAPAVVGEGTRVDAPMPGTILNVHVSQGQAVNEGDVLVTLEAMKMENEILAPRNGTVKQVLTSKGSTVDTGAPLVVIG